MSSCLVPVESFRWIVLFSFMKSQNQLMPSQASFVPDSSAFCTKLATQADWSWSSCDGCHGHKDLDSEPKVDAHDEALFVVSPLKTVHALDRARKDIEQGNESVRSSQVVMDPAGDVQASC
ncbi:hypothetical protein Tco_1112297 [Tanacetum coccineum]|uniref:Uncharacterized protein n=1 Tax=Tanacetum coccineum TaxID=301880 RepID=A0ABQ5IP74_9ASTR